MNRTRLSPTAPAAVCALLLAFVGPVAAQNPYNPMTPANPTPSTQTGAPQGTLTTAPDADNKSASPSGFRSFMLRRIQMPQASGEVRVAPADAAVIVVRLPDAYADVLFDGDRTYTAGTTRTFVTPILPEGESGHYKVSLRGGRNGDDTTKEREVEAPAGRITVVDFTRPDDKGSAKAADH